jgi:glycosyltransferase involved in cell wall biosynthesis
MYRDKTVCVVVPCYNEEVLIRRTVGTMPAYVDRIVVVDDASPDRTSDVVRELQKDDPRVELIRHESNQGVGGAISSGYVWARDHDFDIAVVMAGDGQMDPKDMPALLDPIVEDRADYTKGNRLVTGEAWKKIPRIRYLGNSALTFLTKIASGYWHVTDSQSGYTAINRRALKLAPIEDIFRRYGMPNEFLVTLNIYGLRVQDVPVEPVYGIGEKSGIKPLKLVFTLSLLLLRWFGRRMVQKYIIRDFHPLVLFYAFAVLLLLADLPLIVRLFWRWHVEGTVPPITALTIVFCTTVGMQSLLFAMLFDMEANRPLKGG